MHPYPVLFLSELIILLRLQGGKESPEQELETQARGPGTFPLRSAAPARCLHGNRAAWRGEGLGWGSLPSRVLLLWTPCSRTPSQRPDHPGVWTPLAGRSQTRGMVSAWTRAHHLCALRDNAQVHTDAAACPEPGGLSGGDQRARCLVSHWLPS